MQQGANLLLAINKYCHTCYLHFASMNNSTTTSPPRLSPPGAGLPKIERFFANLLIHWKARHTSREVAAATFAQEHATLLHLIHGLDDIALLQPVLIKRLPGMEDSSRYWSLFMVMDHLRIVNHDLIEVITCLCAGHLPAREANIAAVKPSQQVTASVVAEFDQGCHHFAERAAALPELKTALKFPHPWFGPMDAAAWHFMAGFHMQLHRKQMERILAGLPKS
jgi:hypothetical protein